MPEGFPKPKETEEENPRDPMAEVIKGQELGGVSAALETIYNQIDRGEALKQPEFGEARELVEDFQEIVQHADGSKIPVSEAVQVLRIIAKTQKWNEDHWNFDTIRKEAEKMGYLVEPNKIGSAYDSRKAA